MGKNAIEFKALSSTDEDFTELLLMFNALDNTHSLMYSTNTLMSFLKENGSECYLFMQENIVIGFTLLRQKDNVTTIGQCLYLKKDYRSFKNLKLILDKIETLIKDECDLMVTNPRLEKIYQRRGYKKKYTVYNFKQGV